MSKHKVPRLVDVLPREFMEGDYEDTQAMRLAFFEVAETHHSDKLPWPGSQRFVSDWYVLGNGKAVGVNKNPRKLTFPVITYRPPPPIVTQAVTLRFLNVQHRRFHHVLLEFGFRYSVTDGEIALQYEHPEKSINVWLTPVDGDLEYGCLKEDGRVYEQSDYTKAEWEWMEEEGLDDVSRLERDLHILIKVRPSRMYTPIQDSVIA